MLGEMGAVAGGLAVLGVSARWNWWRLPQTGLPVLMYHKVGDPPEGSRLKKLWVSVEEFRWQMDYLKRHGYAEALTLRGVADLLAGEAAPFRPTAWPLPSMMDTITTWKKPCRCSTHSVFPPRFLSS